MVLCSVLLLVAPLFGREKSDVIVMKNGDHLTCEIKGLNSGVLYVSLDYLLGTSSVQWSKVDGGDRWGRRPQLGRGFRGRQTEMSKMATAMTDSNPDKLGIRYPNGARD